MVFGSYSFGLKVVLRGKKTTMRFILFLLMTFTAAFSEGQTSKTKQPVLGTEVMYGKTTKQNGKWILLSDRVGNTSRLTRPVQPIQESAYCSFMIFSDLARRLRNL